MDVLLGFFISLNTPSTLTHENWNVNSLVRLLIAIILGYLGVYYLWKLLSTSDGIFFSKGIDLFKIWDLQVLNWVVEKKIFKISAILPSFVKTLSLSTSIISLWRHCLIRKQRLYSFSKLFVIHNISRLKLVLTYFKYKETFFNVDYKFLQNYTLKIISLFLGYRFYYEIQNYVGRKIDTLKVSQKWMRSKWTKISLSVLGTILEHWFFRIWLFKNSQIF